MHYDYDELRKADAMLAGKLELLTLDHEEQQVECIGRTLRKSVNASTSDQVSNLRYWTQVWKMVVNARNNAHTFDCTWLCPGIAACGAVVIKWLVTG